MIETAALASYCVRKGRPLLQKTAINIFLLATENISGHKLSIISRSSQGRVHGKSILNISKSSCFCYPASLI